MYEGEKKKMYYSSYLVMVVARIFFLMQTAYLFRQLSRSYSYCSKEKDDSPHPEIFSFKKK